MDTTNIDTIKEELEIFKASANRMRWFISTAVLISVLIILHVYLERFSFQEAQLEGLEANRILTHSQALQSCYGKLIDHVVKDPEPNKNISKNRYLVEIVECDSNHIGDKNFDQLTRSYWIDLVKDYSLRKYNITMSDNTSNAARMPTRHIPILGTQIPANDFVIVMALMSMVFVIGVWLNLRGLHTSLTSLTKHNDFEIMRIAQLNTVFLTSSEIGGNTFAARVRAFSLWLPFISIVTATIIGYTPVILDKLNDSDSYAGSTVNIIVFLGLSILICGLHFWIARQCDRTMKQIDSLFTAVSSAPSVPTPESSQQKPSINSRAG
ncbi:MAG: hypothetical protein JWQ79_4166 [Mucilaginibacter sp.]|nr:hypothetical protein [Mucilaginibacter sp.]